MLFSGETGKDGSPGPLGLAGEVGLPGKIFSLSFNYKIKFHKFKN